MKKCHYGYPDRDHVLPASLMKGSSDMVLHRCRAVVKAQLEDPLEATDSLAGPASEAAR
jgi:hypothetical protein